MEDDQYINVDGLHLAALHLGASLGVEVNVLMLSIHLDFIREAAKNVIFLMAVPLRL